MGADGCVESGCDAELSVVEALPAQVIPAESKIQFWRQAIRRWRASGVSKSAFCRKESLRINTFNIWLLRLSREADEEIAVESEYKFEVLAELPSLSVETACEKGIVAELSDKQGRRRLTIFEGASAATIDAILTKFLS